MLMNTDVTVARSRAGRGVAHRVASATACRDTDKLFVVVIATDGYLGILMLSQLVTRNPGHRGRAMARHAADPREMLTSGWPGGSGP